MNFIRLKIIFISCVIICATFGCNQSTGKENTNRAETNLIVDVNKQLALSEHQLKLLANDATTAGKIPRTVNPDGTTHWTGENYDWTEGFFPGTCWLMYKYTGDAAWKEVAQNLQENFVDHRFHSDHDLGFIFQNSYGHGLKLTENKEFASIMVDAGNTLIDRYDPEVGCIQSWNVASGWTSKRGWEFPVIIDNMMNLELLFELTLLTGNEKYREVAINHANTTLKNHYRADNSSYHVIDYDKTTGEIRNKETAQGYSHESAWARGQAWGLYGFTLCYRYTKDTTYLNQAIRIAEFILNHPSIEEDMVPYWDYMAPKQPNEPRDASAAAITASALIELSEFADPAYLTQAKRILSSLSSDKYFAEIGENNHFLLKHSTGSIPHNAEIDVPIVYADYYYIEALMRLKEKKDI